MKKFFNCLIFILLFFFSFVFQNSFLVHLKIKGEPLNLLLILSILIIFFEKKNFYLRTFFLPLVAGFFLDLTLSYFCPSIFFLILFTWMMKQIENFLKEEKKYQILYFSFFFFMGYLFYKILIEGIISQNLKIFFPFDFYFSFIIGLVYNLLAGLFLFVLYSKIKN